jgi:hypothetical protein
MGVAALVQIAQVVGAVAAASAAIFAGRQMMQARRTAVLQSLQEFFKVASERERALLTAGNSDEQEQAFVELLNFLEVYAAAHNSRLLGGVSKELVSDKLIDAVVMLEQLPHWHPRIEAAITSDTTFKFLSKFVASNRRTIQSRRAPPHISKAPNRPQQTHS